MNRFDRFMQFGGALCIATLAAILLFNPLPI